MATRDELKRRMRAADFVENNGTVMRAINAGYIGYVPLKTVRKALPGIADMDFLKSVNYLQLKGYLLVRAIKTKQVTELADAHYTELEARLSDRGIDLSGGFIEDEQVPM